MKVLHSFLLISLLSASALAEDKVEESHDLGGGFRFDTLAVKSSGNSFESFGHFRYLFYKATKLSQTDAAAVSPSGKLAVYQDGPTGDLYLFEAVNGHKTLLRKSPHALVQAFHWADDEKSADAELEGGVDLTLEVPAPAPALPKKK